MTVNIFEQHFQGGELTKNMYYKDKCFIKSVELEWTYKNFVKFWFYNGCYLVETKADKNSHQCHVIPQNAKGSLVTL
jgi:hypothetical protein